MEQPMKLYFSPGACSLSPHIVLNEAGYEFTTERVDLKNHVTAGGAELASINAKNYVPILELDDGARLTEGPVIVQYLADHRPEAGLIARNGTSERYRTQEWLNFITSELHKSFRPLFRRDVTSREWQSEAESSLAKRFDWMNSELAGRSHLMGDFGVADAYLFTVLNWTGHVGIDLGRWPVLRAYADRIASRPKVQQTLRAEGLSVKAAAA
jgi:glutathione S-transferase